MTKLLDYLPLLNLLVLVYFIFASRNWTTPALSREVGLLKKEVEMIKTNYSRVVNDLDYYIRSHGDTSELINTEMKAIRMRLDQLNEFHERISRVEDNCLIHDEALNVKEAIELLNGKKVEKENE